MTFSKKYEFFVNYNKWLQKKYPFGGLKTKIML